MALEQNSEDQEPAVIIDPTGDLILRVSDQAQPQPVSFRLSHSKLHASSKYFTVLFDHSKFAEGRQLHAKREALRAKYGIGLSGKTWEAVSVGELPVITVQNIGRIGKINNFESFLADFFRALHGQDLLLGTGVTKSISPASLANLGIVADRFNALEALREYVRKRNLVKMPDRTKRTSVEAAKRASLVENTWSNLSSKDGTSDWNEEKCRMKICAGVLLDEASWVSSESAILTARGSRLWVPDAEPVEESSPLWWDLPFGVEGA
jgi:hypothetical protein